MSGSVFPFASSKSSAKFQSLRSSSQTPEFAGLKLGEKYQDKQNVTVSELRTDYDICKSEYKNTANKKMSNADKYQLIKSFCQKLNLPMTDISSKQGVSLASVKPTDFVFSDYTESLVVQMNSQQDKKVLDDPSAAPVQARASDFFEVSVDPEIV